MLPLSRRHPKSPRQQAIILQRNKLRRSANIKLRGARERNSDGFNLTIAWLTKKIKAGRCEVTGLPFDTAKKIFNPSIDRIDSAIGYVEDNCRLVCWGYNSMKLDNTDADALKLAIAIVRAELARRAHKKTPPE